MHGLTMNVYKNICVYISKYKCIYIDKYTYICMCIYIYVLFGVPNFIKLTKRPNLLMLKDKIEQLTGFDPPCSFRPPVIYFFPTLQSLFPQFSLIVVLV